MQAGLRGIRVVSLVGRQGSGKSTIGKLIATNVGTKQIEVSTIVKAEAKDLDYLDLAQTGERTKEDPKWLGKLVSHAVQKTADNEAVGIVILTGLREVEVQDYLIKAGFELASVSLVADAFVRYNRLVKAAKLKTVDQFLTREIAEERLGLIKVMADARFEAETKDNVTPHLTANSIVNHLRYRGLKV